METANTHENINRIELKGRVGCAKITQLPNDIQEADLSVCTNFIHKEGGEVTIETTWHHVRARKYKGDFDLSKITRGSTVHITGRLRAREYTASDGCGRITMEVIAENIELLEN